jgi:predicted DNA-binding protein
MKRDKQTTIRLSEETLAALQRLADADDRPLAAYIRLALERHIARETAKPLIEQR